MSVSILEKQTDDAGNHGVHDVCRAVLQILPKEARHRGGGWASTGSLYGITGCEDGASWVVNTDEAFAEELA